MKGWILFLMLIAAVAVIIVLVTLPQASATRVIMKIDDACDPAVVVPGPIIQSVTLEEFYVVGAEVKEKDIPTLRTTECVEKIGKAEVVIPILREELNDKRREKIRQYRLDRTILNEDVTDREELLDYLEEENPSEFWPGGIISPYQLYVTPDAPTVEALASQIDGVQEAYEESLSWVWISEQDLNEVVEFWLFPEQFLTETPDFATNPTGDIASDCSEQANTLASLLIADGMDPVNVRVVLGLVDFDGEVGGHAWVQVFEDDRWIDVDATAGSYYIDGEYFINEVDLPYEFFKYYEFPIVQTWAYYNNEYFHNAITDSGNAPTHWELESGDFLEELI